MAYQVAPALLRQDPRGRHLAVAIDDSLSTITYRCPCGRTYTVNHATAPLTRRVQGPGLRLLYRYWRDGVTARPCRRCLAYYRQHGQLPAVAA